MDGQKVKEDRSVRRPRRVVRKRPKDETFAHNVFGITVVVYQTNILKQICKLRF